MSYPIKTKDIEQNGAIYRVQHHFDSSHGAPWEECEGYGIVSGWTNRDKTPGELVLSSARSVKRFYDFAATMKIAKRYGWGISGDKTGLSKGEILQRAVMLDYENLRAWCNDEWQYIGIIVFPLTADGDELKSQRQSLWGIESNSDSDYLNSVVSDLIYEIAGATV
jgi:hypothetical protein